MTEALDFAALLRTHYQRQHLTQHNLADASGIPYYTLRNWLRGSTFPQRWQDVIRLALALKLDPIGAHLLLLAANYPALTQLLDLYPDDQLLSRWRDWQAESASHTPQPAPVPSPLIFKDGKQVEWKADLGQPSISIVGGVISIHNYPGYEGNVNINHYQTTLSKLLAVSHPLPSVKQMVGRNHELEELARYLEENTIISLVKRGAATALFGVAGIGKSTLAVMYYYRYQQRYAKVYWRNLGKDPYIGGMVGTIAEVMGKSFDPREVPNEDNQAMLLITWLRELVEPYLLILDDCEAVLDEGGNAGPGWRTLFAEQDLGSARLILTSRQHIRAKSVRVHNYEIEGLSEADGVALLRLWGLEGYEEHLLKEAVARCQGHPLALILLAQLVTEDGLVLEELLADPHLWQKEVATNLLDRVYKRLPTRQKQLICYLSIYDRPPYFRHAASIEDIVGMVAQLDSSLRPSDTLRWSKKRVAEDALELGRRALITPEAGRYTMHAVIRDYAYQRLADRPAHHRAAATFFQDRYTIHHPDAHTHPAKSLTDVQPLLDAFDQLHTAGEYLPAAVLLMGTPFGYLSIGSRESLYRLLDRWSEFSRGLAMLERLVASPPRTLPDNYRATALSNLGTAYFALGEYQKAARYHSDSLELATSIGDYQRQANALGGLGLVHTWLGEYDKAIPAHTQALKIDERVGNLKGQAEDLGNLGIVYRNMGEYQKAIEYYNRHLVLAEQLGDKQGQASALGNLGIAYDALGEYDKAIDYHTRSLIINQQLGDRQGQATAMGNLGIASRNLGDYNKAIDYHTRSLAIKEQIGDRQGQATTLVNLGIAHRKLGNYEQAINYYREARAILVRLGLTHLVVQVDYNLAIAQRAAGGSTA